MPDLVMVVKFEASAVVTHADGTIDDADGEN